MEQQKTDSVLKVIRSVFKIASLFANLLLPHSTTSGIVICTVVCRIVRRLLISVHKWP